MKGKRFWTGLEVEGRLKNISTFFVRGSFDSIDMPKEPHIYFTVDNFDSIDWRVIDELLNNKIVTIECKPEQIAKIPREVFTRVHVLCRVPISKEILNLKPSDTLVLDFAEYTCFCKSMEDFILVTPYDYRFDSCK